MNSPKWAVGDRVGHHYFGQVWGSPGTVREYFWNTYFERYEYFVTWDDGEDFTTTFLEGELYVSYTPEREQEVKYEVGDRVDFTFLGTANSTPGTVVEIRDDASPYKVEWDDGFHHGNDEDSWFSADELVAL